MTEKKCYTRVNMNPVYSLNVYSIKLQAHSLILRLKDLKFYRPDNRTSRTRKGSIEPLYIAAHLNVAISIAVCLAGLNVSQNRLSDVDPRSARILLSNNFESGSADPWYDNSPSSVHWIVEDFYYPAEVSNPPPAPLSGTKYLRATRNSQLSAGLLILRSEAFTALPGDTITFEFWIRSRFDSGNVLELVIAAGDVETTLLTLTSYSTASNFNWRPASTSLRVSEPTDVTLIFYGYCGSNNEDAIAIDDIVLETHDISTTEMMTTTTTPTTTTPTTTTPTTTTPTTITPTTTTPTTTTPTTTTPTTTTPTTTTPTTTTSSSPIRRTVVFIYKTTQNEQNMFIRGGIDDKVVRPVCMDDQDAGSSNCSVSIQVNSLGFGAPWESYDAWRIGDTKLDWFGAQAGQGTYMGSSAFGTPLAWTTSNSILPEYQELNKWGDHYHMVDFDMDCSETVNGWFDVEIV
ncbi:uncharacterized protein LOC124349688 [Daphnia pulicaria]|uniref:uncharacterized protein LOC124349688 n=1 Tax=Daphnia pulicaria TaxID=35523 RepID=UPI001EEB3BB1|nr:uncharacterized protein LOC124349688 [Daphnia pulicaria]